MAARKPERSEIRCATERCKNEVAQYGEHYHSVYLLFIESPPSFMPDAIASCQRCGGYTNGTDWKHVCKRCGKGVEQGTLTGLFVPHRCKECQKAVVAEQTASNQRCLRCGKVVANCYC